MNNSNQTEASSAQTPAASDDEAFLASLRIDQTYTGDSLGVTKPLLTVPLRKPGKTEFVRVHPDHLMDCLAVDMKAERELYIVKPGVELAISEFAEPVRLRLCVTRQGVVMIWPLKLPKDGARGDSWRRSAAEAADLAVGRWVRVVADMNLGAYQPYVATGELGAPRWPTETWPQIVRIATRDRFIDSIDHPVVRLLLGQV